MEKRVVITGVGMITPIGSGRHVFWPAILNATSGVGQITCFDTSGYKVHKGCEVKQFHLEDFVQNGPPVEMKMGKASQLAIAATALALRDAALRIETVDPNRVGVSVGTTCGEIQILEGMDLVKVEQGEEKVNPEWIIQHPSRVIPSNIAHWFGPQGPNIILPTACAAGNYAIGYAYDLIKFDRVDLMIAGGTDPFSKVAFTGFARLGSVAPALCQPFDKHRKGILVGEGAGILVLEALDHALERGAPIYAEMLGYGLSCDGHHMTAPDPAGEGISACMTRALKEAGVSPSQVDYINAHGTGTPANDKTETIAIKRVFGDHAYRLCVSSTKSMIGHTMGAASAIEAIVCALAVKTDVVPPTVNYTTPDPDCDLDYVPNEKQERSVNIALNNGIAFGGNNSCLIFKKAVDF